MKKALAILLTLALLGSLGVSAFAASDTVSGTLADGTVITKPVSEILLSAADVLAKNDSLAAFFDTANGYSSTLSTGVVDFGGAFADIVESTVDVPLSMSGVKVGDTLLVTLSDGSVSGLTCEESGVALVAFPKDAAGIGYYVSSVTADWGDTSWPTYPIVLYEDSSTWSGDLPLRHDYRVLQIGPDAYVEEYCWYVGGVGVGAPIYYYCLNGTSLIYYDNGFIGLDGHTGGYLREYWTDMDDSYWQLTIDENNNVLDLGHYDPNGNYSSPHRRLESHVFPPEGNYNPIRFDGHDPWDILA